MVSREEFTVISSATRPQPNDDEVARTIKQDYLSQYRKLCLEEAEASRLLVQLGAGVHARGDARIEIERGGSESRVTVQTTEQSKTVEICRNGVRMSVLQGDQHLQVLERSGSSLHCHIGGTHVTWSVDAEGQPVRTCQVLSSWEQLTVQLNGTTHRCQTL